MRNITRTSLIAVGCALGMTAVVCSPAAAVPDTWTNIGSGITANISGIAPAASGWVVVRDNKKATQNHVALLSTDAVVTPLAWPGGQSPSDLESVAAVPGSSNEFVVLESSGHGWVVSISGDAVTVKSEFTLPGSLNQVEGLALSSVDGSIVAVWASRGSATHPAHFRAATFSPGTGAFGPMTLGKVQVPYPTTAARQVTSLTIADDHILASSASDPGNRGPFASAVYDVGTVKGIWKSGKPAMRLTTPAELGRYDGHKVEGIACGHDVGILGSDDEKLGAAVRTAAICPGVDSPPVDDPPAGGLPVIADWEMNEAPGATTMVDSSGHGLNGSIGSVVKTGMNVQGAVGYRFPWGLPNKTPADTPRRVLVNSPSLNPGDRDFSVTIRYRTTHGFGNIMQKGQAGAPGGYWKLEAPNGQLTCEFRGLVDGKLRLRMVKSGVALNDGQWHSVTCVRTAQKVTMTIDDTITRTVSGRTGNISNNVPMDIGGKTNCNQVTITCDFYSGDVDRVVIAAG